MSTTGEEHEEHVMSRREREEAQADELRRVIALSQVRQYPEVVLRQVAKPVTEFGPDLIALAGRMERLMDDAHGVGLAAPQVGLRRRLFVFRRGEDGPAQAAVNPEITTRSDETSVDDEGCLSLGPVRMPVERATAVTLEFQDLAGERHTLELEGLDARVVQHELDHLDGVLIIDRTTDEARREAMKILRPDPGPR
jgi:peptide deformylase